MVSLLHRVRPMHVAKSRAFAPQRWPGTLGVVLVLAGVALSGAGCDGLFGDSDRAGLAGEDAGPACVKDREAMSEILARPRSCSVTAECPGGSFCDPASGQCDWQCYADSDCGFGNTCSCEGRCVAGDGADAGSGQDPACVKDEATLATVEDRRCVRDEHCALGARCDPVTRYCTYDCVSDSDCAGAGEVCDCRGACVVPGVDAPPAPVERPTTTVSPAYLSIPPGEQWGKQTLSIRVEAAGPALPAGTALRAYVEVVDGDGHLGLAASDQPGETVVDVGGVSFSTSDATRALTYVNSVSPGTLVSELGATESEAAAVVGARPFDALASFAALPLVDLRLMAAVKFASGSPSGPSCTPAQRTRILAGSDWVTDSAAAAHAVVASVSVGRCAAAGVGADRALAVSTYLVDAGDPDVVVAHLDYRVVTMGTAGLVRDDPTDPVGVFEGVATTTAAAGAEPLTIPVRAWATETGALVLFDDLRLLSAAGYVELTDGAGYVVAIDASAHGGSGLLSARVDQWEDVVGHAGSRSGRFDMTYGNAPNSPRTVVYQLRRVSDSDPALAATATCSGWVGCAQGTMCVTALGTGAGDPAEGRCLPDPNAESKPSLGLISEIDHETEAAWRAESGFLAEANNAYDATDTTMAYPPMLVGERLLCYAYPDRATWADPIDAARPLGRGTLAIAGRQTDPFNTDASRFVDTVAGDGICTHYTGSLTTGGETYTQTAVPVVTGLRQGSPGASHPLDFEGGGAAWLKECLDALSRPVPENPLNATLLERITGWFADPSSCVNLHQVVPALASFAAVEDGGKIGARGAGLFQRTLGQWLDLHSFVASQGAQEFRARRHLGGDSHPLVSGVEWVDVAPAQLLDATERGWDLVLDETYAATWANLTAADLAQPDYRRVRPSAYYSFDAAHVDGTRVLDLVGDNHLTFTTPPTQEGDYVRFASATRATRYARDSVLPLGDATVMLWLHTDSMPAGLAKVFEEFDSLRISVLKHNSAGGGQFRITAGVRGPHLATSDWIASGGWHHIAVVRTNGRYRILVDGGIVHSDASTERPRLGPAGLDTDIELLGLQAGTRIDEFAIWEHALDQPQIADVFERGRGNLGSQRLAPVQDLWSPDADASSRLADERNHEQHVGLPAQMMRAVASHAELIDVYATEALLEIYGTCYAGGRSSEQRAALERAGASLRYLANIEVLAAELYRRAGERVCQVDFDCAAVGADACVDGVCHVAGGEAYFEAPEWTEDYDAAVTRASAARGRAIDAVSGLAACDNPLGIPEEDLPLYFGDVSGDNARFFASSDYLMDSWARPAVTTAIDALEDARGAWLDRRDSNARQLMNEQEAERRFEALEASLVAPIVDACGITEYETRDVIDAFDRGELNIGTCFRQPGCSDERDRRCLRGTMGDAILEIGSAQTALELELRQQERREVEWDVQFQVCRRVSESVGADLMAIDDYNDAVERARRKSRGFWGWAVGKIDDTLGTDLESVVDYLGGCIGGAVAGAQGGPGTAALGCASGLDSVYASGAARDLSEAKDELEQALRRGELLRQVDACWDESERRLRDVQYGMDFARQHVVNLEQARFRLDELTRQTWRNLEEARAVLRRERGRTLPSVAHHYWVDERVDRFRREFERARRLTYLAMRAVEYEFQQSLDLRGRILTATHPGELERVIRSLDAERGTRTINARRPAAGTEVLSLRTDILGLLPVGASGDGERTADETRRLQSILTSPEYAVWSDEGRYLGQGIPFNMAEQGALRHRCGERLWRVSATVQGDLTAISEPGTHVFLLKNNVFHSQWCDGMGDGNDYQRASTSHTTNLIRGDIDVSEDDRAQHTTALLYPWFNVGRSDFYRDEYGQGGSEELAGRGLYGEYVLLFPYHGMLEPEIGCNPYSGDECADLFRDLRQVEDVLIRFDHYSVDNLQL